MDGFGDLHGIVHLQHDAFTQNVFCPVASEFDHVQCIAHFGLETDLGLLVEGLLDAGEGKLRIMPVLPRIVAGKRNRDQQHDQQGADQMNSRYCVFVGNQQESLWVAVAQ